MLNSVIMKFWPLPLLLLLNYTPGYAQQGARGPKVAFDKQGVRVGEKLYTGTGFEVVVVGEATALVSNSAVECLYLEFPVEFGPKTSIRLQTGMRLTRKGDSFILSMMAQKPITLEIAGAKATVRSPLTIKKTDVGWDLGEGRVVKSGEIVASIGTGAAELVLRRLFDADPWAGLLPVDSVVLRFLPHVSPSGFK